jgi:hypothetical protein
MDEAIPRQPSAVVLRSQFNHLRGLLAVALIAVAGLTVAVVILASDSSQVAGPATPSPSGIRYGGMNPGTARPESAPLPQAEHPLKNGIDGTRDDGGPEEGTADVTPAQPRTADVPPGQPRVIQRQGSPALVNPSSEATGDYAHGPLPPDSPAKDYSKNPATGD